MNLTGIGKQQRRKALIEYIERRINTTPAPHGFVHIPGFGGAYSISRDGEVFSHYMNRLAATLVNRGGYKTVTLSGNGNKRPWEIHVLLMRTFVGPCPEGCEVDHRNRIKSDNRLENLRYVNRSLNGHNAEKPKRSDKTRFRGVVFIRRNRFRPWCATVSGRNPKRRYYETELEAALAYDKMAVGSFGGDALTNKSLGLL